MNLFKKSKGGSGGSKKKKSSGKTSSSAGARPPPKMATPIINRDQFIQDMVLEWEALNVKLTKIPEEDWEDMRDEMTEVTDRLYDMKDFTEDYKKEDIMNFKTNEFAPMMEEVTDITKEAITSYLDVVDGRGAVLENWRYCKAYVDERRTLSKGLRKLEEEIKIGNQKADRLEKSALIMSEDAIREHLDELEQVVEKVKPHVDKADLKDYVTMRNREERFIQGCNKAMKELNGYGFDTWAYFKEDLDILQEHMLRLQERFESKEEADEHIASTKAILKIVKKEIKVIRQQKEEEELAQSSSGKKKKLKGAAGKGKVIPPTKKKEVKTKAPPAKQPFKMPRKKR